MGPDALETYLKQIPARTPLEQACDLARRFAALKGFEKTFEWENFKPDDHPLKKSIVPIMSKSLPGLKLGLKKRRRSSIFSADFRRKSSVGRRRVTSEVASSSAALLIRNNT
uniref:Uncharacterized protein n=1 Tax=Grammatophora oceanica TaxID=210454 RepID=A0A7S1URN7_9STRA